MLGNYIMRRGMEFHPVPTIATRFASVWGLTQGFTVGKGTEYSLENCNDGIRASEVGSPVYKISPWFFPWRCPLDKLIGITASRSLG